MTVYTRIQIADAARIHRGFTKANVAGKRHEAQQALNEAVHALDWLRNCGAPKGYLQSMLGDLLDAASDMETALDKELDETGLEPEGALDLSEAKALLEKVQ